MGVVSDEVDPSTLTLVFERAPCRSLFDHLHVTKHPVRRHETVALVDQLARALSFLHSRGWLHCSVTSHAFHLLAPDRGKLGCFEYAVDDATPESEELWKLSRLLNNVDVHRWLAPEVLLRRSACSEASDVYSLCVVIAELLTGKSF
jgi:inactive serine/threonine-protein kinase TEX14